MALVSVCEASGNQVPLRAILNSGSQATFNTAEKAKALMMPTTSSQFTLQTLGSSFAQSQRTCGALPTTVNDSVEVNLHILPRLANAYFSPKVDISHVKHVHNLDLAEPHFITPGKHDFFLGADILENLLEHNIKNKSFFSWVV